jgi:hypothetical protein
MKTELVTTLKRQATEILNQLEKDREPILITQHGVPCPNLKAYARKGFGMASNVSRSGLLMQSA